MELFVKGNMYNQKFMDEAIALSLENVESGNGGPFGAVIVKDGQVIAYGVNKVTISNDPTAHAEVDAIRQACATLKSFQLTGCQVYSSCEPCPMCLGALIWARPEKIYYANTRLDAAQIGFDDAMIYEQLTVAPEQRLIPCIKVDAAHALQAFNVWSLKSKKICY